MLSISEQEFQAIHRVMFAQTGVRLKDSKKPLVVSRLRKRLEELGCKSFMAYAALLTPDNKSELEYLVNALTTNETFFFRHTVQFNYFYEQICPNLIAGGVKKAEVWSGASSTGEEPYSIAIALIEFAKKNPAFSFQVHASDINSDVIAEARQAVYDERALKEVPDTLKARYFKAVTDKRNETYFSVLEDVKRRVDFFNHNLQHHPPLKGMDVIFLRNVLIYFERDIKEKVVGLLEPSLKPGGYFLISLSENLNDIRTGLKLVGPGIFRKPT